MTTYRLRLYPLSPIHVGNGEQLEAYQYALRGTTVHAISTTRLLAAITPIERERYLQALEQGPHAARDELQTLVRAHDTAPLSRFHAEAADGFRRYVTGRVEGRNAELAVRLLPRAPTGAYLPGSSLKGAIRTALLWDQLDARLHPQDGDADLVYERDRWQERAGSGRLRAPSNLQRNRGRWTGINQLLEAHVLEYEREGRRGPTANIAGDPLRALAISDTGPLPQTRFAQIEVWGGKPKPGSPGGPDVPTGISLLAETWDSGTAEATLRIDDAYQDHPRTNLPYRPKLEDLMHACYRRYLDIAEEEADTYYERGWDRAYEAMQTLMDKIEAALDEAGAFVPPYRFPIRLGFGAGDRTLRLAEFLDLNPVSRKLAESLPLGWLLVEVHEDAA